MRLEIKELFVALLALPYIILRRIVPGSKTTFATQLFRRPVSTMATSSFGPYHGLWLDDAPAKRIGIILTP